MKLILIRHGETEWVRQGRYQGSTDVPLNKIGILQAHALGKALKSEKPRIIYCSELLRAYQTAHEIAKTCRKDITVDKRLNELCFGDWEGHHHARIHQKFPKASEAWYAANWKSCPPGGESLKSLDLRINSFLTDLSEHYSKNSTHVLVSHGGPIRMFLVRILKIAPTVFWTIRIDPASISMVHLTLDRRELLLLNSQAHLIPPPAFGLKGRLSFKARRRREKQVVG